MISLTNYDFQWGRSEVVIIYPDIYPKMCPFHENRVMASPLFELKRIVRVTEGVKKSKLPEVIGMPQNTGLWREVCAWFLAKHEDNCHKIYKYIIDYNSTHNGIIIVRVIMVI